MDIKTRNSEEDILFKIGKRKARQTKASIYPMWAVGQQGRHALLIA